MNWIVRESVLPQIRSVALCVDADAETPQLSDPGPSALSDALFFEFVEMRCANAEMEEFEERLTAALALLRVDRAVAHLEADALARRLRRDD